MLRREGRLFSNILGLCGVWGVTKIMLCQGGKRKIHTLEIGGHVRMTKSDLEAQRKSSLSDCTWLER
jgi:hypothetical protein